MQTNVGEETVRAPRSVPQPFSLGNRERLCRLDGEERRRVGPAGSPSTEGLPSAQLGGLLAPEGPSRRRPAGPPAVGGGLQLVRGLGPGGQEGGHSTDLPAHLSPPHTHSSMQHAHTHSSDLHSLLGTLPLVQMRVTPILPTTGHTVGVTPILPTAGHTVGPACTFPPPSPKPQAWRHLCPAA